jgi:hypothetical protein
LGIETSSQVESSFVEGILFASNITRFLLDSGAEVNAVQEEYFNSLPESAQGVEVVYPEGDTPVLNGAAGEALKYSKIVTGAVTLGNRHWEDEFFIIKELPVKVLLGRPTMCKIGIDLRYSGGHPTAEISGPGGTTSRLLLGGPEVKQQVVAIMAKSSRKERREKTRYEEDLKEVLPEHIQIKLDGQEFPLHLKERLFIPAGTEVLVNAV